MGEQSEFVSRLGTERAIEVNKQVHLRRSQGKDIVSFCIGEPDFDTPENIREACKSALDKNLTHYCAADGLPALKRAAEDYFLATRGIDVDPNNIIISSGAKPIIAFSVMALVNKGDEVIYPNPGYPQYKSIADAVGAKTIPLPLREENNFNFDVSELEKIVSSKTKLIILNSPNNPTGSVLSKEHLEAVVDIAKKNNSWIISDEVYSKFSYDKPFASMLNIPETEERTIVIEGMSKSYAMTGWRLGFAKVPEKIFPYISQLNVNILSCTSPFIQMAGIEALAGQQISSENMVKKFKERRELIVNGLNDIPGVKCLKPEGAFYVFPNVTEFCLRNGFITAEQLSDYFFNELNIAVLPRKDFGPRNVGENQEYIRMSYATSTKDIERGLKRIKNNSPNY